jgi:hypothetical protein
VLPAQAATLTVCPSGCTYTHIQDAINHAASGDTISVAAGLYPETVTIPLNLTLVGAGADNTIIDGNQGGTVVTVGAGATVILTGLTIQHGATSGNGGGLFNDFGGAVTLTNSRIVSNTATGQNSYGGGIYNDGTMILTNSTVSGNTAPDGRGGGIFSCRPLTLTNSIVSGNSASQFGGGIDLECAGNMTLTNSRVVSNTATGQYGFGGGIYNVDTLTLVNSTLSANSASLNGGGIANEGGAVTLVNSTLSANSATYDGGGIANAEGGTLSVTDSTLSGNNASQVGGGISNSTLGSGTVTLTTTILAGNTASGNPDCYGTLTSGGYNLVGSGDGCGLTNGVNGDQVGTSSSPIDPLLGPLQNNGGPTLTMMPLPGSPAIDAVAAAACQVGVDQRGSPRPDEAADNGTCDIGAYESGPLASSTATPTATPTQTPTSSATPTATPTASATPLPTGTIVVATGTVDPSGGQLSGTLPSGEPIAVVFPSGAVSTTVTVTITALGGAPPVTPPDGDQIVGEEFALAAVDPSGQPVTSFNGQTITLTFGYPAGRDPTTMAFGFFDTASISWQPLTITTIDTTTHLLTAITTHFTTFAVVGLPSPPYCTDAQHTDPFRGTGDIDGDGDIDLTDFSIFAWDYSKDTSQDAVLNSPYSDMNCNGKVDLTDFSIFATYYGQ